MKPQDLKQLFTFETRRPLLADQIFYVPPYYAYNRSQFPPLHHHFGNERPLCIEYCSGNGDWVVENAQKLSEYNWIAVEKRFDRVRKIWAKIKNRGVSNLLIICGEAYTFTRHYLPDHSIEEIYINFPDPWPKLRHAKHRLLQPRFLTEMARVLLPGKKTTLVTDDLPYLKETLHHFAQNTHFSPFFPPPYFTTQHSGYGTSWFETLWREKGREIHYTQYVRT